MKTDDELLKSLEGMPKPGTLWRHYKGTLYRVQGHAMLEATAEPLVLYQQADVPPLVVPWARPLREWLEMVPTAGYAVPRFRLEETP